MTSQTLRRFLALKVDADITYRRGRGWRVDLYDFNRTKHFQTNQHHSFGQALRAAVKAWTS